MAEARENQGSKEKEFISRYGEIMAGRDLAQLLKFRSDRSFRRAAAKGEVPVTVFRILGRTGWFARTSDVVTWLQSAGK